MRGLQLLHTLLSKACPSIHKNRLAVLLKGVEGLISGNKLTLVNLGRNLRGSALVKNKIKQSDRLIGNVNLYQERKVIYRALSLSLILPNKQPIILVDWSGVTHCGAFHMIRASIPFKGRSLTLYEEVYPDNKKDSPKANKVFLRNLADILPRGCRPIIVTDAGFRNPWFKEVLKLGWDFMGRVRNKTQVSRYTEVSWKYCKDLYQKATSKAQYLGKYLLARSNPLSCKLYLVKGKRCHRKKTNLKGHKVRCSSSLKHAKRNKEPWLIATSLSGLTANKVMSIYKLRMSIEQGFRDIKNYRHGFSLREARSTTVERLSILLLIGALAVFIFCIYGQACELLSLHRQYQTNTIKHRAVLSWFFLGSLVIKQGVIIMKELMDKTLNMEIRGKIIYV